MGALCPHRRDHFTVEFHEDDFSIGYECRTATNRSRPASASSDTSGFIRAVRCRSSRRPEHRTGTAGNTQCDCSVAEKVGMIGET
jgi:hypothetical protein